jgi:hypothetical protein
VPELLSSTSVTSATPIGGRETEPLKITSTISPPRIEVGTRLAQHPADGVDHVSTCAAVGTDDAGEGLLES